MRFPLLLARCICALPIIAAACAHASLGPKPTSLTPRSNTHVVLATQPDVLAFSELFEQGSPELRPSARAQALHGKRVRMVGFMARLEIPLERAFYLTARPIVGDEAGGGTADLPPNSVLVSVPFLRDSQVPRLEGAFEVSGVFELGNRVDHDGHASAFRLQVDAADNERLAGRMPGARDDIATKEEAQHGR